MFGLKIFVRVQTFWRVPPVLPRNFCHPGTKWTYSSFHPPFLCSPMFPLPAFVPVRVCSVVGACRGISQLHPQIPSQSLIKHIIQHNTELTFCIIRSLCIILCTLIIWRKPAVERRPGLSLKANHPTHQYHHQQLDL